MYLRDNRGSSNMDSLSDSIIKLILIDNGTADKLKNVEIYS